MAISFGHKDNKWRSKFSFRAKSMMNGVRNFLSKGDGTGIHRHNEGPVNSFYGVTSNSVLGVAFNDNPSSNKVFKSMSLEGSDVLKNRVHDFAPATSTESPSNNNYYGTRPSKNMGGVLYNGFGQSDNIVKGTSMHYLGEVLSVDEVLSPVGEEGGDPEVYTLGAKVSLDTSYSDYQPYTDEVSDIKYGFYFPDEDKFYFGDDIVIPEEGDEGEGDEGEGDGGGDVDSDFFDNCDTLQLWSENQLYEIVFYPDIEYLYIYTPNSLPVGGAGTVNATVIVSESDDPDNDGVFEAQLVNFGQDYYEQLRLAWRFKISGGGTFNFRLNSYSGVFLEADGSYVSGFDEFFSQCQPGGYEFGQVVLDQEDIDQDVICPQLGDYASYTIDPDPDSQNPGDLFLLTVDIVGILEDINFEDPSSTVYLTNSNLDDFQVYYPTSIFNGRIIFTGLPPNDSLNPYYKLYLENGPCNATFIPWSETIFIAPLDTSGACETISSAIEEAALATIGSPDSPPSIAPSQAFQTEEGVYNGAFNILISRDFIQHIDDAAAISDLDQELWVDYLGAAVDGSLDGTTIVSGSEIRMTAVFIDDSGLATNLSYNLGGFVSVDEGLVFFDGAGAMVDEGTYELYMNVPGCISGSNDYGVKVSTIEWNGLETGVCSGLFDNSPGTSSYYIYAGTVQPVTYGNGFQAAATTGELADTVGSYSLTFSQVGLAGFDLEDYVFFLADGSVSAETQEIPALGDVTGYKLPHIFPETNVVYVQDGGQNFENDNDIQTSWAFLDGNLQIDISNLPLSPDFNPGDEATHRTYYSWGLISKNCSSTFSSLYPEILYDPNYYRTTSPWNDEYGIDGSIMIDSLTQTSTLLGSIFVEANFGPSTVGLTFEPEYTPATQLVLADFDNDGAVTSGDLLTMLSIFGSVIDDSGDPFITYYNDQGQYFDFYGDLNGDGAVNVADLLAFLASFGQPIETSDYENANLYPFNPTLSRNPSRRLDGGVEPTLVELSENNYGLSSIPSSITNLPVGTESYVKNSINSATVSVQAINSDIVSYMKSIAFPDNAQMFAFVNASISGDELRGQTAELLLDLGQEDFELFAVNLNYELLNADHTK